MIHNKKKTGYCPVFLIMRVLSSNSVMFIITDYCSSFSESVSMTS